MTKFAELMEKRNRLTAEINEVDKQIKEFEDIKMINNYETAIAALKNIANLEPYAELQFDIHCNECDDTFVATIEFEEIIAELENKKDRIGTRVSTRK